MIDPRAIKQFLNEARDSFAWMKKISEAQLDRALKDQGFKVCNPERPLRKHQKVGILIGLAHPQFAYWMDMGTGKTRIILELLNHFWKYEKLERALILMPSEEAIYGWIKQIKDWRIDIPYIALGNSATVEKWEQWDEFDNGLILATYPGLSWMMSEKKQVQNKRTGRTKNKMKRSDKATRKITENLDAVIFDESTKTGNHQSLIYKNCRALCQNAYWRYALAGRPFGRDPQLVWAQQFLIDRGETLGETLGLFRAAFFKEKKNWFGGFDYVFDKNKEPVLAQILQHRSISYASEECQSLPKVTKIIERVHLPEDVEGYYEKAVEQIRAAKGNHAIIKNVFLRMRQLSSGFLGYKDDETGEKAQLIFSKNPKLDRMLELIEEIPLDRKFVIFHEYTFSGQQIDRALNRMNIDHGWLWGGTIDSPKVQKRFDESPRMRGLIVNHKLGAMALNLQISNYCIFFESPLSVIDRGQAEKRCFREGQIYPGFIYDLIVGGTVDELILKHHQEGYDIFQALIKNPRLLYER